MSKTPQELGNLSIKEAFHLYYRKQRKRIYDLANRIDLAGGKSEQFLAKNAKFLNDIAVLLGEIEPREKIDKKIQMNIFKKVAEILDKNNGRYKQQC